MPDTYTITIPAHDMVTLQNAIRRLQQAADVLEDTTAVALVRREDLVVVITAIRAMVSDIESKDRQ